MKLRKGDAITIYRGRRSYELVWNGQAFRVREHPKVNLTPADIRVFVADQSLDCREPSCDGCEQVCICEALIAEGWV